MQKRWLTNLKILPFMPSANSSKLDLQYAADESDNVQILAWMSNKVIRKYVRSIWLYEILISLCPIPFAAQRKRYDSGLMLL